MTTHIPIDKTGLPQNWDHCLDVYCRVFMERSDEKEKPMS